MTTVILVVLCSPIFLFRLGKPGLGDPDEGRNAEVAREMIATGDWITPRIDGVVYLDKPPAFFWVLAGSYLALGVSELSARLPSALFALAGIALVHLFARRRLGPAAGWIAGLTLALSPLYITFGRIVIFDMMLTFLMTASVLAAFEAMEGGDGARAVRPPLLPGAVFFAAAGVGTICKGPVALVAPLLLAVTWALLRRRPRMLRRLRFGTGAIVYFAIIVPWLALVEARNPGYLHYAIVGENLERMTSNRFETARPLYFYAKVLLPGLFPWIVLCAAAGWRRLRGLPGGPTRTAAWRAALDRLARTADARRLAVAYAAAWLLVLVLFFSLIASKRPSYMLPCAAPVALLNGHLWAAAFGRRRQATDGSPSPASAIEPIGGGTNAADAAAGDLAAGLAWIAGLCATAGLAAALAGPVGLATGVSQGKYDLLLARDRLFGGTAAALAAVALVLVATRRLPRPAPAFAACALSIAAVVPLAHAASAYLEEARSSRPVSRYLAARLRPEDIVICYEQYRPGLNFYLGRRIHLVTSGTPFSSWWIKARLEEMRRDPAFPIVTSEQMRRLLAAPAPEVYVLAPARMYERLRAEAGAALRPDPVYEDLGAGLFVRAIPGRPPMARRSRPDVLSF